MNVHVRDEGKGPVVVLLHGTSASLHTWEGWARALRDTHRVVRVDGPERLANEWWRDEATTVATLNATPPVRDYYRIEAEDGQRYWIYRDGPFNSVVGAAGSLRTARWYLHGFCA